MPLSPPAGLPLPDPVPVPGKQPAGGVQPAREALPRLPRTEPILRDRSDPAGLRPAAGHRVVAAGGRFRHGAALKFFWGPMDCGKSTLALQMDHNHSRQGRRGLILTCHDRSMGPQVTTRIGLAHSAIEVTEELDLVELVRDRWASLPPDTAGLDYLICDEACFYTVEQIEQLADLVDSYDVDVFAFGLATDFRARLFPAARRLFELADEVHRLQVEVLCWCGREGLLNARVVDGVVAREGAQVVIGDTTAGGPQPALSDIRYQVLCRYHYRIGDLGVR